MAGPFPPPPMADPQLAKDPDASKLLRFPGQGDDRFAVLEAVPEAITVHDAQGNVVFANQAAAALCGFRDAESLKAANVQDWISRFQLYDQAGQALPLSDLPGRRVLAGLDAPERLVRFEQDGQARWAWVSARLLPGFHPPLAINAFREATDVVAAQAAYRENERRLRLALDAGRMGTWEYDLVSGRVRWSPEIERMHGIPEGSFPGTFEAYQSDLHPDDRGWVLETVQKNIARAVEHKLLYRIVRPDGAVRWLEAFGSFVQDPAGKPIRLIGVCSDVTERVESEEARSALRLQRMLEGIGDSFAIYDENWTVLFANHAAAVASGKTPAQLIGKNVWELAPEAVGTPIHQALLRVAQTGQPATFEEFYEPMGRWFDVHAYPVQDVGIAVYSRDITARRNEQALLGRLARYGELRAEVGAALAAGRDLRSMLQACCEAIVAKLQVSFARVWLVDDAGETLELRASAGKYTHIDGGHARVPVGALKIGRIAAERRPHLTNDVAHDPVGRRSGLGPARGHGGVRRIPAASSAITWWA